MSKLIELQFNISDVVYIKGERFPCEIERIYLDTYSPDEPIYEWVSYERGPEETEVWNDGIFTSADIGKNVFGSFEEMTAIHKDMFENIIDC
jgi:hypothetical protein